MWTLFGSTWPTINSPMRDPTVRLPEGEDGSGPGVELGEDTPGPKHRHDAFAEPVRLLEVRIAGEDELVEAEFLVLANPVGDLVEGADERGPDAAAHEPDAGPHVRGDRQALRGAAGELGHAPWPHRLGRREVALRRRDGVRGHAVEQAVGLGPGLG